MADVFISYERRDQAVAARVAKRLRAAGFEIWWDADLPAYRTYSEVIERNLEESRAVVVIWSRDAAKSQWVRAEADFARNAGKLVQASVDGTLPPMPFNQIQFAGLKGWRGAATHAGWVKLLSGVEALASRGEARATTNVSRPRLEWVRAHRGLVAASFAIVLAVLSLVLFDPRLEADRKPVLAVLPFRAIDAQNASLVDGIWEDTRQSIGRNPQIVVLGPNTAQQLANRGEQAAKRAADYLLEASVRTSGDRIRVSTQLVRTKDGEQVWSQDFDRKLNDVFELQSEIASEIEGRIRGRLAEKGGMTPQHISTSSEVYTLYSDARAKVRTRDQSLIISAYAELRQVLKADPNFAPAWAEMSEIGGMLAPSRRDPEIVGHNEEYARKAIDLAPNLAAGHAALALALDLDGPIARSEIGRAVELDPNDFEAVTWLGNSRANAGDRNGALEAYDRAVAIEPLFWSALLNKYGMLKELGDKAGIAQFLEEEKRLGADYLVTAIQIDEAYSIGNSARAANLALAYWATGKKEGRGYIGEEAFEPMIQLGLIDEANKMREGTLPDFAAYLPREEPRGLDLFESHNIDHRVWFTSVLGITLAHDYVRNGRSAKLANTYLSLGLSPDQLARMNRDDPDVMLFWAPVVVIALQRNGHARESSELLSFARNKAADATRGGSALHLALLARIDAVGGRKEEALALLTSAVNRKWIPPAPYIQTDLHKDPALGDLVGDARFEKLRNQILGTIAQERSRVDPVLLRQFNASISPKSA